MKCEHCGIDTKYNTVLERSPADTLRRLREVAKVLFLEQRIDGDRMRDLAQSLDVLIQDIENISGGNDMKLN